jgi:SAM-dependent methyltransferase
MSASKKKEMVEFWSERAKRYGSDPRANTNDVWLRQLEIGFVDKVIQQNKFETVMDFGCANGFSTFSLATLHQKTRFVGIDINSDMIAAARERRNKELLPNIDFKLCDLRAEQLAECFDFIYTIRVFQNMENFGAQKESFDLLRDRLNLGGMLLCIESYLDGYARLNNDRVAMGLPELPIHSHLTLLTDEFDNYAASRMRLLRKDYLSSSYYLVTRVLYSYIAKMSNEPIDYNHPIHQVGALIPQIGDYGPQRATLYQKS